MTATVPEQDQASRHIHETTCPMDCPDGCHLHVEVEDGRVARIGAGGGNPLTNGFICSKVGKFDRRVYHEKRLRFPQRRVGPKGAARFERISWDEAIDEITSRFRAIQREWGSEAIVPYHYGGSNGYLTDGFLDRLYFTRLGASRLAKTLCAVPTTRVATAMYGKMPGVAFDDYPSAKCIVIWGANPKASSIHHVPFLRQAKANGAFVATVDPRANFSSKEIDLHLPVLPGADLPLALGLIRWWSEAGYLAGDFLAAHADGLDTLLERAAEWTMDRTAATTGVSADRIERLAQRYAETEPAVIRCGWGIERNRNGGQAVAAVLAMPALLGKFGCRGGGYTLSNGGGASFDARGTLGGPAWSTRTINMTRLGALLADPPDPPIKGLFVYNCNPAATVPDQRSVLAGLARDDLFTVVLDQVHTDTADYADIVLPATTFLEHEDVRVSYGAYVVGGVKPAIAPVDEARPNAEVFAALGRAIGFDDAPFHWDPAEYVDRVVSAVRAGGEPVDPATIRAGRIHRYGFAGDPPIQFGTVLPRTPDGKIHLTPADLGPHPYVFDPVVRPEYPLALVSPSSSRLISSTFGEFNLTEMDVDIHPDDAAVRGVTTGDLVRVFNDLGEVRCRARVTRTVRPGVVSMPKGAWRAASRNGWTSNALCPADTNVVGGGACYNDARVEIARA